MKCGDLSLPPLLKIIQPGQQPPPNHFARSARTSQLLIAAFDESTAAPEGTFIDNVLKAAEGVFQRVSFCEMNEELPNVVSTHDDLSTQRL